MEYRTRKRLLPSLTLVPCCLTKKQWANTSRRFGHVFLASFSAGWRLWCVARRSSKVWPVAGRSGLVQFRVFGRLGGWHTTTRGTRRASTMYIRSHAEKIESSSIKKSQKSFQNFNKIGAGAQLKENALQGHWTAVYGNISTSAGSHNL